MTIRFVVMTDSHYHPTAIRDWGAPKMLTQSGEALETSVPAVNALDADFIIHGGDLVCGGGSFDLPTDEYEHSIRHVAETYGRLQAPIHYVPGKHDCDAQTGSFDSLFSTFTMPQILNVVDVAPGVRLALANLYHRDPVTGHWTQELDEALRCADLAAKKDDAALLLVLHEWIAPGHVRPGDDYDTGCVVHADRLRATLVECSSVVATFSGHRHVNRLRLWRDIVLVDTACLVGHPLGFREITLDDDGFLQSRFHVLDCPQLLASSRARCSNEMNQHYAGEELDRNGVVLAPRYQQITGG